MTTTGKRPATVGSSDEPEAIAPVAESDRPAPLVWTLDDAEPPVEEIRKPYWIGVTKDCPFDSVTAGGVSFEKVIGRRLNEMGNPEPIHAYGRIVRMSDTELELVKERMKNKLVRTLGARVIQVSRKQRGFRAQAGDIPLPCFCYIVPGDDRAHTVAERATTPKPLVPIPDSAHPAIKAYWKRRERLDEMAEHVEGTDGAEVVTEDWSHITER